MYIAIDYCYVFDINGSSYYIPGGAQSVRELIRVWWCHSFMVAEE